MDPLSVWVGGTARAFWVWPDPLSLGARGVGQHEVSFLGTTGRRDCFLPNEVSEDESNPL